MADDDNLFGDGNSDDGANGDDSGSGTSGESVTKDPKSDKRISDLQSLADKATARANKAEEKLAKLLAAAQDSDSGAGKPAEGNASLNSDIIDMARMFAFQQNPKLAEFGVEMSDITGGTPAEIAANASALVAKFEKIETQARNKVLAENGLSPDISSSAPPATKRDFSKMSKEDFDALVKRSLEGQRNI